MEERSGAPSGTDHQSASTATGAGAGRCTRANPAGFESGQFQRGRAGEHASPANGRGAATGHFEDITTPVWDQTRTVLEEVSRSRATRGLTPTEIATFVFSLKEPIFSLIQKELAKTPNAIAAEIWNASLFIDQLGLYTIEVFQKSREEVIVRQQQELV